MKTGKIAMVYAVLAAALYAINVPCSKWLLEHAQPTMMAAFLHLGAAKTSVFYSVAPFIGVAFSFLMGERPGWQFYAAFAVMAAATVLMVKETISLQHTYEHEHVHTHEHSHGALVHTHEHAHLHTHTHVHDGEENVHLHRHQDYGDHSHVHA